MSQEKIESSHEQTVVDLVEKFLREKPIHQNEVDKLPKEMFTLLNCLMKRKIGCDVTTYIEKNGKINSTESKGKRLEENYKMIFKSAFKA